MTSVRLLLAALVAAATFAAATAPASALPVSAPAATTADLAAAIGARSGLIQKTHGFHCRGRFGYDDRVGYARWHRHPAACVVRGIGRCFQRSLVCRDRWGGGWRYRNCMRRRGC